MRQNRAALYLRLSKEDAEKAGEGDDSASIKSQRLLLTDYALSHQFQIVKVYSDDDESGLYEDRPGFERMMLDAKLGEFDMIIAKTQSRFSRNMEHIEKYLHHDLPNLGIRFIGVVDNVDTDQEGNKKSRQIHGLVNEWYCEDLSKNIRSSLRAKMKNGEFLGSSCPYGYKKDPQNHNHLVIDEYAANVVRRIYRLYLSGYGKAKIGAILSSEGILIPTLYKREVLGENYHNSNMRKTTKTWSYQTIHTILNNETYAGHLVQNRVNTLSYKDKKKKALPREEWIVVKNTHCPIVEPETFEMVRKLQKTRTRSVGGTEQKGVFSGMLYCADCKHAMSRKYARHREREFIGYLCKTYKTQGKQFCESHSIGKDELEKAVLSSLRREAGRMLRQEDRDELKTMRPGEAGRNHGESQIAAVQRQIEKLERYKKKTHDSYMEELISRREYVQYIAAYNCKIKELQNILGKQLAAGQNQTKKDDGWEKIWEEVVGLKRLTRGLVLELIDRIEVDRAGDITIYYKFRDL